MGGLVLDLLGTSTIERHGVKLKLAPPYARVSFVEGIRAACGLDVLADSEESLRAYLVSKGEDRDLAATLGGGRLLDEVFRHALEPTLQQPTFVLDYPVALSPLARRHRSDPRLTERFEFFVLGKELGNAFSELNDADDQRARFEDQVRQQAAGDDEAQQFDADYVRALEFGLPPTGGIGVGIDRLVMLLADEASIRDVILFPAMRPESDGPRPDPA